MGVTFKDGPASGKDINLSLSRAPLFLRVTEENGAFDALDQLYDTPRDTETIHVYIRYWSGGNYHVSCRNRKDSHWGVFAAYKLYNQQPDDSMIRDNAKWQSWCEQEFKELKGDKGG